MPNSNRPFGAIPQGLTNGGGPRLLTAGRSLHPLQRSGDADHSGYPSIGTAPPPGAATTPASWSTTGFGPPIGGLINPPLLMPAITAATRNSKVHI